MVDATDAPVQGGELQCAWSTNGGSLRFERDGEIETRALNSSRGVYEFSRPWPMAGIMLTALPVEGLPSQKVIPFLWHEDGKTLDRADDVTWDVELRCGVSEYPHVWGEITVDGERRLPSRLTATLMQEFPPTISTLEDLVLHDDRTAIIRKEECEYWAWPVTVGAQGVWLTSVETIPAWFPLTPEMETAQYRIDAALHTGRDFILTVVAEETAAPVPLLPLIVEYQIIVDHDPESTRHRVHRVPRTTDEEGRCLVRGVPEEHATLIVRSGHRLESSKRIFASQVEALEGDPARATAVLPRESAGTARVWGYLPAFSGFPAEPFSSIASRTSVNAVCEVVARAGEDSSDPMAVAVADEDLAGGRWSLSLSPGEYELWVRSRQARVSEIRELDLEANEVAGPFELLPLEGPYATFEWTGGPLLATLTVKYGTEGGHLVSSTGVEPIPERGVCAIPIVDSTREAVRVEIVNRGVYEVFHVSEELTSTADAPFDLHGKAAVPLVVSVNGQTPSGEGRLSLYRLKSSASEVTVAANCVLRDGATAEAIPLPPGDYYYFLHDSEYPGAVCGIARLGAGGTRSVLAWTGTAMRLKELPPEFDRDTIELVSIGGRNLDDLLPIRFRRFRTASLGMHSGRPIHIDLYGTTWR